MNRVVGIAEDAESDAENVAVAEDAWSAMTGAEGASAVEDGAESAAESASAV